MDPRTSRAGRRVTPAARARTVEDQPGRRLRGERVVDRARYRRGRAVGRLRCQSRAPVLMPLLALLLVPLPVPVPVRYAETTTFAV
ncbi:hypothetical protein GCM10017557_52390 [Streptomyces aurantiacus]|uniref:Uncharacterized protein n=1 Tax=Streptomyces aurantiacus TaxID=47760 RepID=A0A7G1P9A9_9ACTN|nr:hypothetical protein GCM10017557_52390 [Streptomyces aurantiacus]